MVKKKKKKKDTPIKLATKPPAGATMLAKLSPRQLQVAQAIAMEWKRHDIRDFLGVTLPTVQSHINMIHSKLGTKNDVGIARIAYREKLVAP